VVAAGSGLLQRKLRRKRGDVMERVRKVATAVWTVLEVAYWVSCGVAIGFCYGTRLIDSLIERDGRAMRKARRSSESTVMAETREKLGPPLREYLRIF